MRPLFASALASETLIPSPRRIRGHAVFCLLLVAVMSMVLGGCSNRYSTKEPKMTADGLVSVSNTSQSRLWVKPDHHLGRYDDIWIKRIGFDYGKGQTRLDGDQEEKIGEMLRGALGAFTTGDPVGKAVEPGPCVVSVILGLKDLRLHQSEGGTGSNTSFVSSFGSATMIVEFRDSMSDVPLLRYAAHRGLGAGPGTGQAGADLSRLGKALGDMVTDMTTELQTIVPDTTGRVDHDCHDGIYRLTGRG